MRTCRVISLLAVVFLTAFSLSNLSAADKILSMSTTTSTQASGLLNILLPAFEKDTGIKVKVIAKGTGAAIRDGVDGNVDVIFVHAKSREEDFVKKGYGTKRYAVMHNDFVILGPANDPAKVKNSSSASSALKKIALNQSTFVSRGDDSGTHTKEQFLWKQTKLKMKTTTTTITKKGKKKSVSYSQPIGSWYNSIGQGMGKVLTYADEKQSYTMSDRGTYIKYKFGRKQKFDLTVLHEGDKALANPYGIIPINPKTHPHVKHKLAVQFAEWLVSARGQKLIDGYRLIGKQLFYPDAI
ncbi:MAG: solute-binding protein [Deltaproteobacteria bacterium]|jgi:tungstate transport system substrate-binding protein|nr:solute-binding protein [Deltaproteobacteria bacterium]MBT4265716.1 solute-binding protein [Deltaproteobacteria bacterium]MBT4644519.1 solute-binding protein [Deltaproteobacteria bacterium]MBT6498990.1 solute-binding protein [Deltaproteobacteria bacterium]MBT6613626.1 solute-binding protein [Deltaproteobacteria bacterium]